MSQYSTHIPISDYVSDKLQEPYALNAHVRICTGGGVMRFAELPLYGDVRQEAGEKIGGESPLFGKV